jgi:hypothetical protein
MSEWGQYLWVVAGIAVSFVIPVVKNLAFPGGAVPKGLSLVARVWPVAKPYVFMAILSLLLAVVTFAIAKSQRTQFQNWYAPFLLGYFWDATIQKFKP